MTPEEHERMLSLCQQIVVEKDHNKFNSLIRELNDLLERKQKRIEPRPDDAGDPNLGGGFAECTRASWTTKSWDNVLRTQRPS